MKVTIMIPLVAAIDSFSDRRNCCSNDISYSDLLKSNNMLKDKYCSNGICLAYINSPENEKFRSQDCEESCQPKSFARNLFQQISPGSFGYGSNEIPRKQNLAPKPSYQSREPEKTVAKEFEGEADVVTVIKTEVKTVTINSPMRQEKHCDEACRAKRREKQCDEKCRAIQNRLKSKSLDNIKSENRNQLMSKKSCKSDEVSACSEDSNDSLSKPESTSQGSFRSITSPRNEDVTVTRVMEKTTTVEKPLTLYREMTTTLTVEKPLINYKVTTFTKISTSVESITVTKFIDSKGGEVDNLSTKQPNYFNTVNSVINYPHQNFHHQEKEMKNLPIQPVTITKFMEKPSVVEQSEKLIPTIVKTVTRDSSQESPISSDKQAVSISTIVKTVTRDATQESQNSLDKQAVSISTIVKTVTRDPSQESQISTDRPPVSIATITKTVVAGTEQISKSSSDCIDTVTVTVNEKLKTEIFKGQVKDSTTQETNSTQTVKKFACEDLVSCFNLAKGKLPKNSGIVTKAVAKGCEITTDTKKAKPRTICRFFNIPSKKKESTKNHRKKRTVFKTVFDEDSVESSQPKTVSA